MSKPRLENLYSYYKENQVARKGRNEKLRKRTYAFVIDLYAIVFANKALTFIWLSFVNNFVSNISASAKVSSLSFQANTTHLSLAMMFFSYFFFSYYLGNGQTLGKLIFNLKVVSSSDVTKQLSALDCFGRAIGYVFINLLYFLPLAINFLRQDHKGIHDFISHTHVISTDEFAYALAMAEEDMDQEHPQISLFDEDAA